MLLGEGMGVGGPEPHQSWLEMQTCLESLWPMPACLECCLLPFSVTLRASTCLILAGGMGL